MTDELPNTDDLFSSLASAADGKPPAQPERSPDLTELEPDDGFDEEYVFEPSPAPVPPARAPEPESEDLAEELDWDLPIGAPPASTESEDAVEDAALAPLPESPVADEAAAAPEPDLSGLFVYAPTLARVTVSIGQVTIWQHAVIDPARLAGSDIERRAAEIATMGQTRIPRARVTLAGDFEVADGVLDIVAVRLIAEAGGSDRIDLDVARLTDAQMFRFAHQEGRTGASVLAYDRARSIRAALDLLGGTQKEVAETLGLDEATVTNSLHILKVEAEFGPILSDPWRITENQAKRFQKIWSDPARQAEAAKMIAGLEVGTARAHLATLFKAFPSVSKNERSITDTDGQQLGTLRRSAGRMVIKLGAEADTIPADDLGALIAAEIGASRK